MKFLNRFKNRAIHFIKDDDGADLLEICAGIVFAIVLIVVVKGIIDSVSDSMSQAGDAIDNQFDPSQWISGGNSNPTP